MSAKKKRCDLHTTSILFVSIDSGVLSRNGLVAGWNKAHCIHDGVQHAALRHASKVGYDMGLRKKGKHHTSWQEMRTPNNTQTDDHWETSWLHPPRTACQAVGIAPSVGRLCLSLPTFKFSFSLQSFYEQAETWQNLAQKSVLCW